MALILKSIVWPIDYIVLAKDNKKQFFKQQLLGDSLNLVLTIILYKNLGLLGIGLSILLNYIISGLYLLNYVFKNYNFRFNKSCVKTITISAIIGGASCVVYSLFPENTKGIILFFILIVSVVFSYTNFKNKVGDLKLLSRFK